MKPERLNEIRQIASLGYMSDPAARIGALRDVLSYIDDLEAQIADLRSELNGAKGRAKQADERPSRLAPISERREARQ